MRCDKSRCFTLYNSALFWQVHIPYAVRFDSEILQFLILFDIKCFIEKTHEKRFVLSHL